MILRRFMQHVGEQNWLAVCIDVAVVVGSVFLATQLSVALDRQAQEAELATSLRNLSDELTASLEEAQGQERYSREILFHIREALAVLDGRDPDTLTDAQRQGIFRALTYRHHPTFIIRKYETLLELQNSGNFSNIKVPALRGVLSQLLTMAKENDQWNASLHRGVDVSYLDFPFLERELLLSNERYWGSAEVVAIDWEAAQADRSFRDRLLKMHHTESQATWNAYAERLLVEEAVRQLEALGYSGHTSWWAEFEDDYWIKVHDWTGEYEPEVSP